MCVRETTTRYHGDEQWRRQRTSDPLRDWPALHAASVRHPESFWAELFEHEFRLKFVVPPRVVVDRAANLGAGAWLPGAYICIYVSVVCMVCAMGGR